MNTLVMVFPTDKTRSGLFMLAKADGGGFGGWAREDSSFTKGETMVFEESEGVGFETAEDAIHWAESAPRYWQVINKAMFDHTTVMMPKQMTVSITSATYTPWYAIHKSIQQRMDAGEQVRQVDARINLLDEVMPIGGCFIVIDSDAISILNGAGIRSPQQMEGRILLLESDDVNDMFRPLRLIEVLN